MYEDGPKCRGERLRTTREPTGEDAGQYIAGARCREPDNSTIMTPRVTRARDDIRCVGFEDHDAAKLLCNLPCTLGYVRYLPK